MLKRFSTDLKEEFQGYNSGKLAKDIMAGLTVAAVALPLALAFGVSSGADAASGLITAIIAGFVISALSGAFYQISGPTGAMAAVLISILAKYRLQGVFIATVLAGIILLIAGFLHLGKLTTFIPAPVITGFTSGIAVIIALGQLDNFFGVASTGDSAIVRFISYFKIGFSPNLYAIGIGIFVIAFMFLFPKKWGAVVPASLLSIIIATAITMLLGLDIKTVGEIPKTLLPASRLNLSSISLSDITGLLSPALSIAMLGMIESLLCGSSAGRMTGKRLNSDQELIAQGIGNIIIPFFGGIPATAAIARTSVAIKSGAQTRLTGIFHALGLMVSMFLLAPVMSAIPLSALAGVLLVTAWRMNEWESIKFIFSRKFKGAILKYTVTMIATVVFDLTAAILIGVLVALVLLVKRLSSCEINYDKVDMSRIGVTDDTLIKRYSNSCVVYIAGPIIFANTHNLENIVSKIDSNCDTVFLSMRGASHMDISGAQTLLEVLKSLKAREIDIIICGLSNNMADIMRRSGITELLEEDSFYWSVDRALLENRPHRYKMGYEAD